MRAAPLALMATSIRCAQAAVILLTTTLETGSRVVCAEVRRRRFLRRDPAQRDSDAHSVVEEIVRGSSFVQQRSHHARALMLQEMRQSTRRRPSSAANINR